MSEASSKPVKLLVLEGDGIGPEIMQATLHVLKEIDALLKIGFVYETAVIGFDALRSQGTTFPAGIVDVARAVDGIILGPVQHNDYPPTAEGGVNPSGELRKQLDLYANIRPARTHPEFASFMNRQFDLVIVRENTEGFYADRNMFVGIGEFMPTEDVALAVRKITRKGSMRIAEEAFRLAMQRRKKVTTVHKANVLRVSDGLFLDCVRSVAARYPDVAHDEKIVDAMSALLVRDPGAFDVILATNMFGDILSDEATELSGSIGLAASINVGEQYGLAQAQHGSAPDIAGQDIANPASLIGSAAMLLAWMGQRGGGQRLGRAAQVIDQALMRVLSVQEHRTGDLGGAAGTKAFGVHVANATRAILSA